MFPFSSGVWLGGISVEISVTCGNLGKLLSACSFGQHAECNLIGVWLGFNGRLRLSRSGFFPFLFHEAQFRMAEKKILENSADSHFEPVPVPSDEQNFLASGINSGDSSR